MARLFWNREKTSGSFAVLRSLVSDGLDFVLIGGWAVYYYTRQQESLDVDIAISYDRLEFFRNAGIADHEGTRIKYSIRNGIYVDIFVSEFSDPDLPISVSEILKHFNAIDGVKVVDREMLLLLKLWGYFRDDEVKVRKDIIDVASLVIYGDINLSRVAALARRYKIPARRGADVLLEYMDKAETLTEFVGMGLNEYKKAKILAKRDIHAAFG